jgi:hypothetical protein
VTIHNQSEIPFIEEDGFDIATGFHTNVEIYKTIHTHLPNPYSDCLTELTSSLKNSEPLLQQLYTDFNLDKYNQKYCLKVCFQAYVINQCDCYSYEAPISNQTLMKNPDLRGCSTVSQVDCLTKSTSDYFNSDASNKCTDQCPIECDLIYYSFTQSLAKYPSNWLISQIDYKVDTSDMLMLNVFFDEMFYSSIVESPAMTIDQLFGLIGGNLGLFLGMSFLTLLESIEFIYYALYFFLIRHKKDAVKKKKNFPFNV